MCNLPSCGALKMWNRLFRIRFRSRRKIYLVSELLQKVVYSPLFNRFIFLSVNFNRVCCHRTKVTHVSHTLYQRQERSFSFLFVCLLCFFSLHSDIIEVTKCILRLFSSIRFFVVVVISCKRGLKNGRMIAKKEHRHTRPLFCCYVMHTFYTSRCQRGKANINSRC